MWEIVDLSLDPARVIRNVVRIIIEELPDEGQYERCNIRWWCADGSRGLDRIATDQLLLLIRKVA